MTGLWGEWQEKEPSEEGRPTRGLERRSLGIDQRSRDERAGERAEIARGRRAVKESETRMAGEYAFG